MRAARLMMLVMLLQARGRLTAQALAAELEVSERTIYRDVEALLAAGVPVWSEPGRGGGFVLPPTYRTNLTGLTQPEVRALFAASIPDLLAGVGLRGALHDALRKLAAALPNASRRDAEDARQRLHVDPLSWSESGEPLPHLAAVQEAVWQTRVLWVRYRTAKGRQVERLLHPYGLVAKAGIWYLVAANPAEREQVLRVSRICEACLTEESFTRPVTFDLARYWRDWCAKLKANHPPRPLILHLAAPLLPGVPPVAGERLYLMPSLGAGDDDVE